MTDQIAALHASVDHLRELVTRLDPSQLEEQAYPTQWRVAAVLSHLGSGGVIMARSLDDGLAGTKAPDDFAQSVWDEWNAMEPAEQADGVLAADAALIERLESLSPEEIARFEFSMGPMTLDLDGFVGLRLNEHVVHTWDVEVTFDPSVTLNSAATPIVVGNLAPIARYTGHPGDEPRTVAIRTTDPVRHLTVELGGDAVEIAEGEPVDAPDLELPAEALIRLVYGRLDEAHTPALSGTANLDVLRAAFPGF
jgi:uncharacterized protein (TIGR03083 family)